MPSIATRISIAYFKTAQPTTAAFSRRHRFCSHQRPATSPKKNLIATFTEYAWVSMNSSPASRASRQWLIRSLTQLQGRGFRFDGDWILMPGYFDITFRLCRLLSLILSRQHTACRFHDKISRFDWRAMRRHEWNGAHHRYCTANEHLNRHGENGSIFATLLMTNTMLQTVHSATFPEYHQL
jgi:hypothetical protein